MSGFTKEIIAKTFTELLDEKPMSCRYRRLVGNQ